jgi:hypothetical protein
VVILATAALSLRVVAEVIVITNLVHDLIKISQALVLAFLVLALTFLLVVTQFLTHLFDKIFEKSKNSEKQRKSKKICFNIFPSFLAFSTSSKKEFKFSKVFRMRLTFHASF